MTKTETLKELLRAMELTTPKNIALRIAMTAVLDIREPAAAPDPKPAEPTKIADEMKVSEQTVRNHLVKAGLV